MFLNKLEVKLQKQIEHEYDSHKIDSQTRTEKILVTKMF